MPIHYHVGYQAGLIGWMTQTQTRCATSPALAG
jgi:hypothetical protein